MSRDFSRFGYPCASIQRFLTTHGVISANFGGGRFDFDACCRQEELSVETWILTKSETEAVVAVTAESDMEEWRSSNEDWWGRHQLAQAGFWAGPTTGLRSPSSADSESIENQTLAVNFLPSPDRPHFWEYSGNARAGVPQCMDTCEQRILLLVLNHLSIPSPATLSHGRPRTLAD